MTRCSQGVVAAVLAGLACAATGAEPAANTMEPAVDTSAARTVPAPPPVPAVPAAASPASAPAATAPAPSSGTAARGTRGVQDRLELDATQITGNRELPRVMYVVPWKRADLGDLTGRPVNSLLDEVLAPVDRDVFQRQNRYYEALRPDAAKGAP